MTFIVHFSKLAWLVAVFFCLTACGQKGRLFIPEEAERQPSVEVTPDAVPDAEPRATSAQPDQEATIINHSKES